MNQFLATKPFDLYELELIRRVAITGSFTVTARQAGLTQSAVTRQVQGVEDRLGIALFHRTTRRVSLTDAGRFFLEASGKISGDVDALIQSMRGEFGNARPEIKLGLSRSIGLAFYPGFLVNSRRRNPDVLVKIWQERGRSLLESLEENAVDLAVTAKPDILPRGLEISHQFQDSFVLIAPASESPAPARKPTLRSLATWADRQPWILLHEESVTGARLRKWIGRQGITPQVTMEADNFDLIINLVSLGYGSSFVPHRALALYNRKKGIRRILVRERFTRTLAVLSRKQRRMPVHLADFIDSIVF